MDEVEFNEKQEMTDEQLLEKVKALNYTFGGRIISKIPPLAQGGIVNHEDFSKLHIHGEPKDVKEMMIPKENIRLQGFEKDKDGIYWAIFGRDNELRIKSDNINKIIEAIKGSIKTNGVLEMIINGKSFKI